MDRVEEDREKHLISLARTGDQIAFERLIQPYLTLLYRYITLHLPQSDVEDTLQESLLAMWQNLNSYGGQSAFKAWMMGVTRNKVNDQHRRSYRTRNQPLEDAMHLDAPGDLDQKLMLEQALAGLSHQEQELTYLVFTAGLTYNEVSALTGTPLGTIKSKMHYIRFKLLKELEGEAHAR